MTTAPPETMEAAAQRLISACSASSSQNMPFDVSLLDSVVSTAYDPMNVQRSNANKALMALQENPDVWTKADAILEKAQNAQTRFFGLQILDDAIRTRYVFSFEIFLPF